VVSLNVSGIGLQGISPVHSLQRGPAAAVN